MRRLRVLLGLACLGSLAQAEEPPVVEPPSAAVWGAVRAPSEGPPRAIGRYSGGCLDGAARLAERGEGYFVTRPERGRFFGHPVLIALIESLGARMRGAHLPPLPIGDLSQPRGGPAPSGHASHQTGLDVDIAYLAPVDGHGRPLVDLATRQVTKAFGQAIVRLLALVAGDPRVDRIFVNPSIKRALCEQAGKDRTWLHKVRPWWGHHEHFHVRLACPKDSTLCEPQAALPEGDGCGELGWWFKPHDEDREQAHKTYQSRVGSTPTLPEPCRALVEPATN